MGSVGCDAIVYCRWCHPDIEMGRDAVKVKRYDFGTQYRGNTGVPGIVGKVDGRYVRHDDYAAAVAHNEYLLARLQKTDGQLAAIKADRQQRGEPYNYKRIGWELERTAMGDGFYGNALRVAKDIPGVSGEDRDVLDRYAAGTQQGTDHIVLQNIARNIYLSPQPADQNIDYKHLYEQMCERCDYLDAKLAEYSEQPTRHRSRCGGNWEEYEMTKQELEKEISQWEDEVSALVDELESARNHLNWLYEQQDKMRTS